MAEKLMKGKISVLCGQSGVGKSSLINALNPVCDKIFSNSMKYYL